MTLNQLDSIDSFIAGLLTSRKELSVHSVKQLGGHQTGLIEIIVVKTYGESRSRVYATVFFDPTTKTAV